MPAKTKRQEKAASMALAARRGRMSPSQLVGAARRMYESMSERQLEDLASPTRKGRGREQRR